MTWLFEWDSVSASGSLNGDGKKVLYCKSAEIFMYQIPNNNLIGTMMHCPVYEKYTLFLLLGEIDNIKILHDFIEIPKKYLIINKQKWNWDNCFSLNLNDIKQFEKDIEPLEMYDLLMGTKFSRILHDGIKEAKENMIGTELQFWIGD